MADRDAEVKLARHNLHVSFAEIRRIKRAIRDGTLLELVDARARGHPTMLDGYRTLLEQADHLEAHDPVSKGTFFHVSAESARWPAVARHHDRIGRISVEGEILLATNPDAVMGEFDERWHVQPPFGPIPTELRESYPLTAEVPERLDTQSYEQAATGITRFVEANPEASVTVALWDWPETALATLPDAVERIE
jgi:7-cyano-7-deazaguanine tRNA-ribosyltransferase